MKPASQFASVTRGLAARFVVLAALVFTFASVPVARAQLARAMWVWEADNITDTAKRTALVNFCVTKGITTVFIHTGTVFLDPADYGSKTVVTNAQMGNFCIAMHGASTPIKVWAVDGDPSYCLTSNHPKVLGRLDKARVFNYNQAANARIDGFQWDIEPHGLAAWKNADTTTRKNYLSGMLTIAQSVNNTAHTSAAGRLNLNVGFVLPFWYDTSPYDTLTFNGVVKPAAHHMFDVMKLFNGNHVGIMAYKDTVPAPNGSFPLAQGELDYAKASAPNVKVWYGQETKPADGVSVFSYNTFDEERTAGLEAVVTQLNTTLSPYRPPYADVIAGVAIHAYSYYKLW